MKLGTIFAKLLRKIPNFMDTSRNYLQSSDQAVAKQDTAFHCLICDLDFEINRMSDTLQGLYTKVNDMYQIPATPTNNEQPKSSAPSDAFGHIRTLLNRFSELNASMTSLNQHLGKVI